MLRGRHHSFGGWHRRFRGRHRPFGGRHHCFRGRHYRFGGRHHHFERRYHCFEGGTIALEGGNVTGSHFSTNRAAGRHAEQQHRRDSCRRERLRLPSNTAGQTPTVHRYQKQVTAGRHVITACQSDTASFSSPPGRYCLPTWRDSPRSYCQLLCECLRLPSNRSRPGITSHRAGQHVTFHALTSWLLPPARTSSGGRPPSTLPPTLTPHPRPLLSKHPLPSPVRHNARYAAETSQSTSTGQAPSWRHISQPIDYCRCRPTRRTGDDPSGGVRVSGCQHLVVSWHSVGLRTRFPAAAPCRPSRRGAGNDRWGPICVPTRWKEVRVLNRSSKSGSHHNGQIGRGEISLLRLPPTWRADHGHRPPSVTRSSPHRDADNSGLIRAGQHHVTRGANTPHHLDGVKWIAGDTPLGVRHGSW